MFLSDFVPPSCKRIISIRSQLFPVNSLIHANLMRNGGEKPDTFSLRKLWTGGGSAGGKTWDILCLNFCFFCCNVNKEIHVNMEIDVNKESMRECRDSIPGAFWRDSLLRWGVWLLLRESVQQLFPSLFCWRASNWSRGFQAFCFAAPSSSSWLRYTFLCFFIFLCFS